eukprot:GHVU01162414.1.p2 GENE.GHVU01162414.1~~GHVU01162414.1.p2  ORF type:complete len:101 (-),score=6.71 GHVU01162414.1:303-605(-)
MNMTGLGAAGVLSAFGGGMALLDSQNRIYFAALVLLAGHEHLRKHLTEGTRKALAGLNDDAADAAQQTGQPVTWLQQANNLRLVSAYPAGVLAGFGASLA